MKKIYIKYLLFILFFSFLNKNSFGQNIAINTTGAAAANCAILDVSSSSLGLLIPRVALTDVTLWAPLTGTAVDGVIVYSTAAPTGGGGTGFYYWSTVATAHWVNLVDNYAPGSAWMLAGNGSTTPGTDFIGTTDAKDLQFKINGTLAGLLNTGGNVFFGINAGLNNAGTVNTYIGSNAGKNLNQAGADYNTFVGRNAGIGSGVNPSGGSNTFIGTNAGNNIFTGYSNSSFGTGAGFGITSASGNVLIGANAGNTGGGADPQANCVTTGSNNTFIGYSSGSGIAKATQLTNASAIGYSANVNISNAMVLGNGSINVGIGNNSPSEVLHVQKDQNAKTRLLLYNNTTGTAAVAEFMAKRNSSSNSVTVGIGDPTFAGPSVAADFQGGYLWTDASQGICIRTETSNSDIHFTTNQGATITEAMRILGSNGYVGIGTASPGEKLEVSGIDPIVRIRNTNDAGGGFVGNTWSALQLGMYNPSAGAWGVIGAGVKRSFFGFDNNGKVGSLTNNYGSPVFRNILDDGSGNGTITGYLKVGAPTAPANLDVSTMLRAFADINASNNSEAGTLNVCGTNPWTYTIASTRNAFSYTPIGSKTSTRLITQWWWVPIGSTGHILSVEWSRATGDNTFDGVWVEMSTNGTTWSKMTPTSGTAYTSYAGTTLSNPNSACANMSVQTLWCTFLNDNLSQFTTFPIAPAGKWVLFSLTGSEDGSVAGGRFDLFGLSLMGYLPSGIMNGTFQTGNIYAEKNVFAGSNVLMGDVAEYFVVDGIVEAGELVSLSREKTNHYIKTRKSKDANVIGIVSTNPTLTINSPSNGTPIALTGRVPVKVTNEGGEIKIGDYLTASSTPGYAMKAEGNCYAIGKAIEPFNNKEGKIICLIENGWINTNSNSNNTQSGGAYYIPKGTESIIVRDASVTSSSRVFVSMLADAGSNYWLSKKENGMFEISLTREVNDDIKFDYFIDNALKQDVQPNSSSINGEAYTEIKSVPVRQATEEDLKVPPTPSDPSKCWKYENGKLMEYIPPVVKHNTEKSVETIKEDVKTSTPKKK